MGTKKNSESLDNIRLISDMCNWSDPEKIAIEYTDVERIHRMTYADLKESVRLISTVLLRIENFEFIAISYNVAGHMLPPLILSISNSGHAFINMPSDESLFRHMRDSLYANYLFTSQVSSDMETISSFELQDEIVYLVRINSVEQPNLHSRRKYNYAYAICTSGSTGEPKLIRVPHSCIIPNILDLKEYLSITNSDKIAQLTSITFDPSIIEIFLALVAGGTLFMVSELLKQDTNRVLEKVCQSRVTVLQMTPSVFLYNWSNKSLKSTLLGEDSFLRIMILGGEPFPKTDAIFACKHSRNKTKFFNIYGITEVSCWASINEIETEEADVRYLGRLLSQTMFEVRGTNGDVIRNGEGFLYIGSSVRICVIDDEIFTDLTKPVFRNSGDIVRIDEEGKIFYKSRANSIIKRYGNRMDLIVLENAIMKLNFIRNCYALWNEEHHQLHLCLLTMKEDSTMKNDILNCLYELPAIYRPDKIHFLEKIEVTSNGKICMEKLKSQYFSEKSPSSDIVKIEEMKVEEIFEKIWKQHLIDMDRGFVDLGGNSVTALQISSSITKDLNAEFPQLIGMFLKNSRFSECLSYIKENLLKNHEIGFPQLKKKRVHPKNVEIIPSKKKSNANLQLETTEQIVYKCRGREEDKRNIENINTVTREISKIKIEHFYNSQKCIDASPTIFQYSSGSLCATVGSHSGIIFTVELVEPNPRIYEIKLPDRIEASILVLDNFRGIIGCYDNCVHCIDLKTGEVFWKFRTGDVVKCTAVVSKDNSKIFVGSYDCHAYCLSAKDGTQLWKLKPSSGSISASGCLHEKTKTILFGTLDGTCLALHQSSGQVSWKYKFSNPIFVAPVVLRSGLVLFCSVAGEVSCFNIEQNIKIWDYSINGNVFAYIIARYDPSTEIETIILTSQNKGIYVLQVRSKDLDTAPSLKYLLNFEQSLFATPCYFFGSLFVAGTDGTLSISRFTDPKPIKLIKLPGDVFSSPVVHDNYIFVGCRDNNLYILKLIENQ